jgi:hypothetical protein
MSLVKKESCAIIGPPHSGKSVFLAELYRQLLSNREIGARAFLQRACPDGEGMWSAEADQAIVKAIRQKGEFSPEAMMFFLQSVSGLAKTKNLTMVDCGGMISMENVLIMARCTSAIILSSKPEKLQDWRQFCQQFEVITQALKDADIDSLMRFQKAGCLEVLPQTKMVNFPTDYDLFLEIKRRVALLHVNLPSAIEKLEPRPIAIRAELGSRLLSGDDRQDLDAWLVTDEPTPIRYFAQVDTSSTVWRGEMVDLDRDRGTETYATAINELVEGFEALLKGAS